MIHSTVIIHAPARYWFTLHPGWCGFNDGHKRQLQHEHIEEVERALSLPGLQVHVMLVHKSEGEYTVERVRIPWSYRLWWLLNGEPGAEQGRCHRGVHGTRTHQHRMNMASTGLTPLAPQIPPALERGSAA